MWAMSMAFTNTPSLCLHVILATKGDDMSFDAALRHVGKGRGPSRSISLGFNYPQSSLQSASNHCSPDRRTALWTVAGASTPTR